jgi:outer membrane protein TolC
MRKEVAVILLILISEVTFGQKRDLDFFIKSAYRHSPLIQKQANRDKIIDLDMAQFKRIYSSPTINLNANVLLAPIVSNDNGKKKLELVSAGATQYYGYDLGASNGGQYQALISVNQPLFTKNHMTAQQDKANVLKEQYKNKVALTQLELQQTVTHQYILCLQSKKLIDNAQQSTSVLEAQIKEMRPLVKAGIIKYIDLKLLEIELQNSQIEQERLTADYQNNLNALYLLCGISPEKSIDLQDIDLQISKPKPDQSAFEKQYQLDSLRIISEQKISNLKYLPQVNAFGDTGLNATYLPTPNRLGFSVGIGLTWNLFDGNQQKIKQQQDKIKLENIEIDKHYFINQNAIRKQNLWQQINSLDDQLALLNKQLATYQKLLGLYQAEIKDGLVSILELKTLIKEINLKKQSKINIQLSKQILINAYNYWNH